MLKYVLFSLPYIKNYYKADYSHDKQILCIFPHLLSDKKPITYFNFVQKYVGYANVYRLNNRWNQCISWKENIFIFNSLSQ